MIKLEEKEDRINELPDSILQHILSFLASTTQAIQTGILSKRWQNQWTRVPVLSFDSGMYSDYSVEEFAKLIYSCLLQHDCSKIKKLHLAYHFERDTNFSSKIRFATRKHVEELILTGWSDEDFTYLLPKFLLDNDCLVKLEMIDCGFVDDCPINWGSLKSLKIEGYTCRKFVANALLGTPSLELLEINASGRGGDYLIASKSLKILIIGVRNGYIEILCPNLKELSVNAAYNNCLAEETIANVVYGCLLLCSLQLRNCNFNRLVIVSKSLKKLVLRNVILSCCIEISCPNLEELNLRSLDIDTFKVMNFPSLIYATLESSAYMQQCSEHVAKQILEQLQNVKELSMGGYFIKILSDLDMKGLSYAWSNNNILTLDSPNFEHLPGIMCALRSSPVLERLVIKFDVYEIGVIVDRSDLNASGENYWNSNWSIINSLLWHLKTVEIIGLSQRNTKCELVLNFIKFVLKNARVLKKLVLVIAKDGRIGFAFEVSQKVSNFPRCSEHAIVELCSE